MRSSSEHRRWTGTEQTPSSRAWPRIRTQQASDANGQIVAHQWRIPARLAATDRDAPAVNLKLLIEGEEARLQPPVGPAPKHAVRADLVVYFATLASRAEHPAVCVVVRE